MTLIFLVSKEETKKERNNKQFFVVEGHVQQDILVKGTCNPFIMKLYSLYKYLQLEIRS
jgi:hypothetical protein